MKKTLVVMLAIVAVAAAGCKKKEEAPKANAPEAAAPGQMPAAPGQMPGAPSQMPAAAPGGGDPHAGLKPQEIKSGAGHKGKVTETMDSGGYTYVQVEENGQKVWVAVMQTKVKVGDTVEFPDSPPMINFQSKTLKRTFEKIIFAPGIKVN
ncbi:hypothetical protein GMLC_42480 [Geomonas limicola]|uniref:Lipoprotein n=1 Tax=Geomonas limicola TaxID=2740186 RepID=A0A6V8NIB6_9BACT|nr:hypothetical protein [Geomonas limicola]GFO70669.1 hypothetical protein GMLC_42480 [Geomonas limicola]